MHENKKMPSGRMTATVSKFNVASLSDADLIWMCDRENIGNALFDSGFQRVPDGLDVLSVILIAHGEILRRIHANTPAEIQPNPEVQSGQAGQ